MDYQSWSQSNDRDALLRKTAKDNGFGDCSIEQLQSMDKALIGMEKMICEDPKELEKRPDFVHRMTNQSFAHLRMICMMAVKMNQAEFLSWVLSKRKLEPQYRLFPLWLMSISVQEKCSQQVFDVLFRIVKLYKTDKITSHECNVQYFQLLLDIMKTGNQQQFRQLAEILPVNTLVMPTQEDSKPYSRLVELFVDSEVWDNDCMTILMKCDRLNKTVLDENHNTLLHQLVYHYKPAMKMKTFRKRFEFALSFFGGELNEVNASKLTVSDVLVKNGQPQLARLVDNKIKEQHKNTQRLLDDLLADIDYTKTPRKKKNKKSKRQKKLDDEEESKDAPVWQKDEQNEAAFNPQDNYRPAEEQEDDAAYFESLQSQQLTPFQAQVSATHESSQKDTVSRVDYEKVAAQTEFMIKQRQDSLRQIELLQQELDKLKASKQK